MIKDCFVIDLDKAPLEIKIFSGADVAADLKYFRVKKPQDLSDYDRKVFTTELKAKRYLAKYKKALAFIRTGKTCLSRDIPMILYKRRYMAQSLMREKNQTYRDSKRVIKMMSQVKPGDRFNLYDQTYILTVVLTSVSKSKGVYKYCFKLPRLMGFK